MSDVVLLTGATGQVGAAVLPRLVQRGHRVLALIRARDDAHRAARLAELRALVPDAAAVDVVVGDVTQPGLGLDAADAARVLGEATAVLHSAASVRFDLPDDALARDNVRGTLHVLELARRLADAGRLRRLDHVSTCYVAGDTRGVATEDACDVGQGFRNAYEATKCRSEMVVRAARADGLPIAIHRPAIVVGDSRTGATRAFNVLYWPLKFYARGIWRLIPANPDVPVDLVPVDWVADALAALRDHPDAVGRCFHLAAGDDAPTIREVIEIVRDVTGGPPVLWIDPDLYLRRVRPLLVTGLRRTRRYGALMRGGRVFLPYLVANPRFDVRNTRALLGAGPPPAREVLPVILRWAMERDFGGGGRSG